MSLPAYFCDFVIFEDSEKKINVVSTQAYHSGNLEDSLFSSYSLRDCISFIQQDAGTSLNYLNYNSHLSPLRRLLSFFWKLTGVRDDITDYEYRTRPGTWTAKPRTPDAIEDKSSKQIEFAGWLRQYAETKVGTHPVFNFVPFPPKGYQFTDKRHVKLGFFRKMSRVFSILFTCLRFSWKFHKAGVSQPDIVRFWASRKINLEYLKITPGKDSVALYPTFTFICPNHSWIIEIEDMLTMMVPFVSNGSPNPALNRNHAIIKILGVLFADDSCLGVISHLDATARGLRQIFKDEPKIIAKIRSLPLGMPLPPPIERKITNKKTVKFLFMNGWAQDRGATYRRGLLDALKIFQAIGKEFENVELVVRSQIPELSREFQDILRDPRVTVLEHKISRKALESLYESCDILLFPAVRIAVTTLLQAMSKSLAIVASDGFGIDEYIEDGVNGLIAKGFNGASGHIDEDGFFRENYMLSLHANPEVVNNSLPLIRKLLKDESFRVSLQNSARQTLEDRFSIERWNESFGPILDELFRIQDQLSAKSYLTQTVEAKI